MRAIALNKAQSGLIGAGSSILTDTAVHRRHVHGIGEPLTASPVLMARVTIAPHRGRFDCLAALVPVGDPELAMLVRAHAA
jgi:hypothetical protein